MTIEAPTTVLALWWIALGLTLLVIGPLATYLLHRTWKAARNIRRYTEETLEAGTGTARATGKISGLDETLEASAPLLERTGGLRSATAEIEEILRGRVG